MIYIVNGCIFSGGEALELPIVAKLPREGRKGPIFRGELLYQTVVVQGERVNGLAERCDCERRKGTSSHRDGTVSLKNRESLGKEEKRRYLEAEICRHEIYYHGKERQV